MSEPKIAQKSPYEVDVNAGDKKVWCTCGHSAKQPYCDGAHARNNTGMKPMVCNFEKSEKVFFCGCKHTKNAPFCDGSHNML
jgi:CDGSH iron-sulfur domain-containing protein 3